MPSVTETLLIAAGSGLTGGGFSQLFRVGSLNRKTDAESAKVLALAYGEFVDDLRNEIRDLRQENRALRDRIISLETKIDLLSQPTDT